MAEFTQQHGHAPTSAENYDLWLEFLDALRMREGRRSLFRWVPSHVHPSLAEDSYEAWIFTWNNVIDELVSSWNRHRDESLKQNHDRLEHNITWWSGRVWQLRSFYFFVGDQTSPNGEASSHTHTPSLEHQVIEIALETDEPVPSASISDQLPVNWQMKCRQTPGKVPGIFIESILQWLCATEQLGD